MARTFANKSEWARFQLTSGKTVSEVEAMSHKKSNNGYRWDTGMGYSFIHGIAKRAGIKATGGRKVKSVSTTTEFVTVRCDNGVVIKVNRATGQIARSGVHAAKPTAVSTN